MTDKVITKNLRQILAFVRRNVNISKKYMGWEIVFLVYHVVGALAIGFLAKGMEGSHQGSFNELLLFLLVGSIMWVYLSSIFHEVGQQISLERWQGTIEYTFMAPVKRILHLIGNSVFAIVYGIVKMALVLLAVALLFKISLAQADLWAAFVIMLVAAISFIGLGMIASIAPLMSPEMGDQSLHIVEAVIMLVSGIYYEITVLPGWMQTLATGSPATYALEGMRKALIDGAGVSDLLITHLTPLLLMGIAFIPLGLFVFSLAEKRAKRLGKLKRNG